MPNIQDKFRTFINEQTPVDWSPNWKDIPACYLYDFFDSIEIYVSIPLIPHKHRCDFGAQVVCRLNDENTVIWNGLDSDYQTLMWQEIRWNETEHEKHFAFSSRKEAEIAAFTKAFELAETIF